MHLWIENAIAAIEIFLAVKTLKAGKALIAMKSDLICSKP